MHAMQDNSNLQHPGKTPLGHVTGCGHHSTRSCTNLLGRSRSSWKRILGSEDIVHLSHSHPADTLVRVDPVAVSE